ncbi:MAG: tetratricopeptide repeat protein, partial [Planctomycetes bacterium]|nr:tetratricopeptide repeat protein [Planctomycetota bacterium]
VEARDPGPALAEALANARASVERGDWDAARAAFQDALVLDANNADALHGLWRALLELKDPQYLERLRRAVDADPRPQACLQLAVVYSLQERHAEGLEVVRRGLQAAPDDAKLVGFLGRSLASLKRYAEALEPLQRSFELEPEAGVGVVLAKCLMVLERHAEALRAAEGAFALDPGSQEARYLVGYLRFKLGRYAEALEPLRAEWEQSQGAEVKIVRPLVACLREVGEVDEALAVVERGLRVQPESADLLFIRSSIFEDLDRGDEALADLDALLLLDPNQAAALNNRSLMLFHRGRYEAALADAERLVQLEPESVSAWTQVGASRYQLKDYAGARDAYTRVAKIEPESLDARVGRAQCLHRMQEYEAAVADYRWILARNPDLHSMRLNLGLAYGSLGEADLARETMRDLQSRTQPGQHHYIRASDWLAKDAEERGLNPPE